MRGILSIIFTVILLQVNAQGINFQGVARSANGTILASSNISLRLSIISKNVDATPEYVESKTVMTNAQGIFSVVVGDETKATVIGVFKNINWSDAPKFLKVEMDPAAGTNYINMGATQLQYVPYSFYSYGVDASGVKGVLPVDKGGTGVASLDELKKMIYKSILDSLIPVSAGGTGVNNLAQLKAALNIDTSSFSLPVVSSSDATAIKANGATISGNIVSDGGSTILKKGICFDTIPLPNTSISQVLFIDQANSGTNLLTGIFDATIDSYCKPNTKYYYRTFAINKNGTAYSAVKNFTTLNSITFSSNPTVTVDRNAPTFNFSVKTNGDTLKSYTLSFLENGLYLPGDALNVTVNLSNQVSDTAISYFFPKFLTASKNYICEITINSNRISITKQVSFSTSSVTLPHVRGVAIYPAYLPQYPTPSYRFSYNILSKGGVSNVNSGVIWTTSFPTTPDISLSTKTVNTNNVSSTESIMTTDIIGLSQGVNYYFTPYVTNSAGTAFGAPIMFMTPPQPPTVPTLTTLSARSISSTSAILGGEITSNGGATVTTSGVVWSTSSNPTTSLSTKTTNGPTSGTYSSTIAGLTGSTVYYYRPYATNSVGTGYGAQSVFSTLSLVPILSNTLTPTVTSGIGELVSLITGGTVSSDNGSAITERGVVFSTNNSTPTYSDSKINTNLDANQSYQCLVMYPNIFNSYNYYFRAYAKNANGIGYGPVIEFYTPSMLPNVNSVTHANITTSSVVVACSNAYPADNAPLTDKGFIWSTSSSNLTVNLNTKISAGNAAGAMSTTISNLNPGTTYYIVAYASNSTGTKYSSTIQITTNQ